ncbi:MAG: right-handed parallel beta-helix repeat-containing protein, partial [Planctomycetaceae bacterium]
YGLVRNVVLGPEDSGVRIEGPAVGAAVLDRGNTNSGSYVVELAGADDVTLSRLTLTGGQYGVFAGSSADSDRFRLENSLVTENGRTYNGGNVLLNESNDDAWLVGNTIRNSPSSGLVLRGARGRAQGNEVSGNVGTGIDLQFYGSTADRIEATDNLVHHNSGGGIVAVYQVRVADNTVWGHTNTFGIHAIYGATIESNEVFDNQTGIQSGYYTWGVQILGNRVYHNTTAGIRAYQDTTVSGNVVYANSTGIELPGWTQFSGEISNNLVYANSNQGIRIEHGSGGRVHNNTVSQRVGQAVLVEGSSSNISLRNNILWVETGSNIVVASDSQMGFRSDYNTLMTSGTGTLGRWENRDFDDLADWRYEVGQDEHSLLTDPQFIDRDGPDNALGFSPDLVPGTARILDNGDAGFSVTGGWTAASSGYQSDSAETATSTSGNQTATWTVTGLDPDAWYEVSVTWPARSESHFSSQFTVREGATVLQTASLDQRSAPDDFTEGGTAWERLGTHYVRGGTLTVQLNNYSPYGSGYVVSADAVRIQKLVGDRGADDNFQVGLGSPTIDAGDPASPYLAEPGPNGRRVNQGYTGSTSLATTSPTQLVQVLSPQGLDKYEVGQPVTIRWQSAGLTQVQPTALVNVGGSTQGGWQASAYQTVSYATTSFTNPVDRSGVTDPAPEGLYQTMAYGNWGAGSKLAWQIPAANGNYTLRLHFAESWTSTVGERRFDIRLQGTTVTTNYDVYATAGAAYKATAMSYPVTVTGGTGISVELVSQTHYGAILSGIELLTENAGGTASPTANVELSNDNGVNWTTLASAVPFDRFGQGQLVWTPTVETSQAVVRVRANQGTTPADVSNGVFQVANAGVDYYVNDASTTGDLLTTAVGDNRNSGKSPGQPMASLAALVAAYDLDAGDIIHVETGTYGLVRNVVLGPEDSGVRIEGPAVGAAVLDRGNTNSGSYVVELAGADDVTLSRLTLTGGQYGVFAGNSADSDRFRLENSLVTGNGSSYYGGANVLLDSSNDDAMVVGNTIRNSSGRGIDLRGARGRVQGNEVSGNAGTGIEAQFYGSTADQIEATDNRVHHNSGGGIVASYQVRVADNTVWGHTNSFGIQAYYGATIESNEVFDNQTGIQNPYYSGGDSIIGNRVYHNTTAGIWVYSNTTVSGNVVYANPTGIKLNSWSGEVSNNLVYANSNQGIQVGQYSSHGRITNNTVYQSVGNAVLLEESSSNITLRNNILWVEAGYDIYVASNSTTGFQSDFNLLFAGADPNAHIGYWEQSGTSIRDSLSEWVAATSQDTRSIDSNPNFVDLDGADNVLGYSELGNGYNGGRDDNFYQARLSAAIDAGDAWAAPRTDIVGRTRLDDPGVTNHGSADYAVSGLGSSQFNSTGTPQNWRGSGTWTLSFPGGFSFPFYGTNYSNVVVSSSGFLHFAGSLQEGHLNTTAKLIANRMICPLWDNLHTSGPNNDIFLDTATAGQVTIRWNATNEATSTDVNFSVTLVNDGTVRFHYGSGNTGLSPTVGISRGDGRFFVMGAHDGAGTLTTAESLRFALTPGLTYVDIGAYEFRGNSNDATPPQVLGTTPAFIEAAGSTGNLVPQIALSFSEELNVIDANAPANYELRQRVNGTFGDSDDIVYNLSPSYSFDSGTGASVTTLGLGLGGAALPGGTYRLTVFGRASNSLHDTAGNRLDGNRDGSVSGSLADEYVREFVVAGAGITVSDASGDTTEAGGTATFSVVLTREPTANVTVALSSSDPTEGTIDKSSLVFTPANWNTPQVVTITGIDDTIDDGDVSYSIVTAAAVSADPLYSGLDAYDPPVTNRDDDGSVLDIEAGPNRSSVEGDLLELPNASYTAAVPASQLTLTINWGDGSSEPGVLVPTSGTNGGTIANTHRYADNGSYTVTLTLTDGTTTVSDSFVAAVSNVAPAVGTIAGLAAAVRGQTVSYSLPFLDAGSADTHTTSIDWGDGTSSTGTVSELSGVGTASGAHVYTTSGNYTITFTVTDDDGAATSQTKNVSIVAANLQVSELDPTKTDLFVGGTTGNDTIALALSGTNTTVTINSVSAGAFAPTGRIVVFGQAGNDNVTVASTITRAAWLYGDDGNDTLTGGGGSDVITGGAGTDSQVGGAGNDTYLFDADTALGIDTVNDSAGIDTLDFSGTTGQAIALNLALTTAQVVNANLTLTLTSASAIENVTGGSLHDTLTGNSLANTFIGGLGNDTLTGAAGNDIYRFNLDDTLGADTLNEAGGGIDTLDFSPTNGIGATVNLALATVQTVASGRLTLVLGSATTFENIIGGAANDSLAGNTLANTFTGGAGDDTLTGGTGNDTYRFDADTNLGTDILTET